MPFLPRLHSALKSLGLDVRRYRNPLQFLRSYNPRTILDIGANSGQFALRARAVLPHAVIHAFEPLPEPFAQLDALTHSDALLFTYPLAIGDHSGPADFHQNEFSPSSSLLELAPDHLAAYPFAAHTTPTTVPMLTLDHWTQQWEAENAQPLEAPLLIKADVQGYEDRVLAGATATLARADLLILEVSFVPLYLGQPTFDQLYDAVRALGFHCAGFFDTAAHPDTGTLLQADALFTRTRVSYFESSQTADSLAAAPRTISQTEPAPEPVTEPRPSGRGVRSGDPIQLARHPRISYRSLAIATGAQSLHVGRMA